MATASINRTCCICSKRITQQSDGRDVSADKKFQAAALKRLAFPASASAHKSCLKEIGRLNQEAAAQRPPTRATPAALLPSDQKYTRKTDIDRLQGKLKLQVLCSAAVSGI